jgi:hypothetical protein
MINWTKVNWILSDTALAAVLGTSRQNVSAARKRRGAPASPERRGGDRKSIHGVADSLTIRGVSRSRRGWSLAAKAAGMTLNDWIIATLNADAGRR